MVLKQVESPKESLRRRFSSTSGAGDKKPFDNWLFKEFTQMTAAGETNIYQFRRSKVHAHRLGLLSLLVCRLELLAIPINQLSLFLKDLVSRLWLLTAQLGQLGLLTGLDSRRRRFSLANEQRPVRTCDLKSCSSACV